VRPASYHRFRLRAAALPRSCSPLRRPGIDFTNDPLLQGRNFSYLDTQLKRLGSPNFSQLPVNGPKCPFAHFQQDGHMTMVNPVTRANYEAHCKFIAYTSGAAALFQAAGLQVNGDGAPDDGFVSLEKHPAGDFITRCRQLRFWDRQQATVA